MSNPSSTHALIDKGTHRVTLPVPKGSSTFSIRGQWGDDDHGPEATLVSVILRTRKASRNTDERLMRDAEFALPPETEQVEVRVLQACPGTSLTASVVTQ